MGFTTGLSSVKLAGWPLGSWKASLVAELAYPQCSKAFRARITLISHLRTQPLAKRIVVIGLDGERRRRRRGFSGIRTQSYWRCYSNEQTEPVLSPSRGIWRARDSGATPYNALTHWIMLFLPIKCLSLERLQFSSVVIQYKKLCYVNLCWHQLSCIRVYSSFLLPFPVD